MDKQLIKRDFDQMVITHKSIIPETIDDVKGKLNGLSGLLTASDWYRAAIVRAYTEKGTGGVRTARELLQLSIREFAELGIKGLSTQDAVRHYYAAWESLKRPKPLPGEEIILPDKSFPEWGTTLSLGGLKSSESVEWYTPEKYIEAAREVMGSIDLDPASSKMANEIVKAKEYITQDDEPDGLNQEWYGNIWLNPPYGKGSGLFTTKLIEEYLSGRVDAAILLLNAYGFDSAWFQPLWNYPICFTDHRIVFYSPQKESGGPANANIFVYLGKSPERFRDIFKEFGHIVKLWIDAK